MLGVLVSHSSILIRHSSPKLVAIMVTVGLVATPTFLLLSGVICGYMAMLTRGNVSDYRWRLIDRALFLLLVVHLVLSLTHALWQPFTTAFSHSFYITDAVAICLLVAAMIPVRMRLRMLFAIGVTVFAMSWLVSTFFTQTSGMEGVIMRLLVGEQFPDYDDEGYIVPILPYLAIFLIGLATGRGCANLKANTGWSPGDIGKIFIVTGAICMMLAVMLKCLWLMEKQHFSGSAHWLVYQLTEPRQKLPPGPAYVLFFGGLGLASSGIVHLLSVTRAGGRTVGVLGTLGRSSLVVFVVQYWFFFFPGHTLGIGNLRSGILVVLPVSIAILWLLARKWDALGGNRLFTVGILRLRRHANGQALSRFVWERLQRRLHPLAKE